MNTNRNPRGSRGIPTTGTNAPPTANQAQLGGHNPNQQNVNLPLRSNTFVLNKQSPNYVGTFMIWLASTDLFTTTTRTIGARIGW